MKTSILGATAYLFAVLVATRADGAPLTDTRIDSLINAEVPKAALRWNLKPLFQIVDGATLAMNPNGIVQYGREGVRTALVGFDEVSRELAVRWIVGHETWHQVQRRDAGIPRPEDLAARRQLECEADVMASQYVVDSAPELGKDSPDLEKARRLGITLNSIIDMVQQAERGYGGAAAHPSGEHRRSAIRYGLFRAMLKQAEKIPEREARLGTLAQISAIIDLRDDEQHADWTARICRMLMHNGDGQPSLSQQQAAISFNKNGDPPIVDYSIPYRNVGATPISVVMQVATIAVPRLSPENTDAWKWVDGNSYRFDLAPGQQFIVSGRLVWHATEGVYPRLLMPTASGSLYAVTQFDASVNEPDTLPSFPLTPRQSRLASILQMIFNSSVNKFEALQKEPCQIADGNKICRLSVDIPGARSAEITYEGSGAASVDISLFHGDHADEASTAFSGFKRDLETIYATTINERTTSTGMRVATFKPKSTLKLDLRHYRRENRNSVTATITPALY